jgi:hypothetical protein
MNTYRLIILGILLAASPSVCLLAQDAAIKDALTLPLSRGERGEDGAPAESPLQTRWAADVTPENAWREYPRPQLVRQEWESLNGLWDYAIEGEELDEWTEGRVENANADRLNMFDSPHQNEGGALVDWEGKILVPFCVESSLSRVGRIVRPNQIVWYRRTFEVPDSWRARRIMLNFDAVDWHTIVWVNGRRVGENRGGYVPFQIDITDALLDGSSQEVRVAVWDPTNMGDQGVGKQSLPENRRGFRYTPTTGIWQSVWMEPVAETSIERLEIVPNVDDSTVSVRAVVRGDTENAQLVVFLRQIGQIAFGNAEETITIPVEDARLWSPDDPFLYDLSVTLQRAGNSLDQVDSYFAMRKISIEPDEAGVARIMLNGEPIFQYGPLDQGYWPDGILTPPSDDAARYDLQYLKDIGCNMVRVHIKTHPDRWYAWADRLGLLVWQDFVCTRKFESNITEGSAAQWESEQKRMIDALGNHPSIVMWVVFNEGWGQYDTERLTDWTAQYDPSRLVNGASGWTDQDVGDVYDVHDYSYHTAVPNPTDGQVGSRAVVLGECGGFDVLLPGHIWHHDQTLTVKIDPVNEAGREKYPDIDAWAARYEPWLDELRLLRHQGLCAAVYTQISDVEHEPNGWLTYDRAVSKIPIETLRAWHDELTGPLPTTRDLLPLSTPENPSQWSMHRGPIEPARILWFHENYDDSDWAPLTMPMRRAEHEGEWPVQMRRMFTLDHVPDKVAVVVKGVANVDVYINGVKVKTVGNLDRRGFVAVSEAIVALPEGELQGPLFREGENSIAVRCFGPKSEQIDVGLLELLD